MTSPETKMARLPYCRDVTVGVSSSGLAQLLRRVAERLQKIYAFDANGMKVKSCHGRHAEKQVKLKARHTSHGELPYEKQIFCQATQTITRLYVRLVWGAQYEERFRRHNK